MLMSDKIAQMIERMLDEQNGSIEIKRNEFAITLGCVPSQINYVITSRFNKERGYIVESRRGGGGYIKIVRPSHVGNAYLYHLLSVIGDEIDCESSLYLVKDMLIKELITNREAAIISAAVGTRGTHSDSKVIENRNRADIFKGIVINIIKYT